MEFPRVPERYPFQERQCHLAQQRTALLLSSAFETAPREKLVLGGCLTYYFSIS
jgi:hypothetical protein